MPSYAGVEELKPNIGVFTNPSHDLWIDKAEPTVAKLLAEDALRDGEVAVGIKSTGICG